MKKDRKIRRQKDDEWDLEIIQTTSNEQLKSKKGDGGGGRKGDRGAVSSSSFDLLNSMIYDLKRSVDLG